jgi:hypothetical protein
MLLREGIDQGRAGALKKAIKMLENFPSRL